MIDMGSIAAALGGLKTAGELAKAIIQIKSEVDRNAKVIELQSVILAAQSSAIAAPRSSWCPTMRMPRRPNRANSPRP